MRTDGYQAAGITAENSQHRSETEQERIDPDVTIINNGQPDDFARTIDELIERMQAGQIGRVSR